MQGKLSGGGSRPTTDRLTEFVEVFLFKGSDPFYGQNFDIDQSSLSKGWFRALNNVRGGKGALVVRGGIDDKTQTGITAGVFRGALTCKTNGTYRQIVGVSTASATPCYYGADNVFTQFTAVALNNKYGLTNLTETDISFCVVRDTTNATLDPFAGKNGRDLILASDGVSVIVFDPAASPTDSAWTAKHQKVTPPSLGASTQAATFSSYLTMTTAEVTPSDSSANTVTVDNGTKTGVFSTPRVRFSTAAVANDYGQLAFATGAKICDGSSVKIMFHCSDDADIFNKLKISMNDGSVRVLYDASSASYEKPKIVAADDAKGFKLAVFKLDKSVFTNANNVTTLRFEWIASVSPTAQTDLYILGAYGGGTLPGGSSVNLTRFNSGSRAESGNTVCLGIDGGKDIRFLGLQSVGNAVDLPVNEEILYAFDITTDQITDAQRDLGIDYLLVYVQLPNTPEALLVGTQVLATYDPTPHTWAHSSSRTANQRFSFQLNSDVLFGRVAPDRISQCVPPFKCSAYSGSRLFVGAAQSVDSGGSGLNTDVWISDQGYPFRFREIPRSLEQGVFDPASGTRVSFPGESPKQIASLSSFSVGSQPVLVWTEESLWKIEGQDAYALSFASRQGPHGTLSPRSVATYGDTAYWLDQNKELKSYNGRVDHLSYMKVDEALTAIPSAYLSGVAGLFWRGEYFLSYPTTGTTNTVILVYDDRQKLFHSRWVSNSTNNYTYSSFHVKGDELRFWMNTGNLFEIDSSQGDDEGTAIPLNVTPGELSQDLWRESVYGNIGILCSDDAAGNLTATWTGRQSAATDSGSSSINVTSGTLAYRWIAHSSISGGNFGIQDVSALPAITGDVTGGTRILAITAKVRPLDSAADAI